jgi:hypothetical protein
MAVVNVAKNARCFSKTDLFCRVDCANRIVNWDINIFLLFKQQTLIRFNKKYIPVTSLPLWERLERGGNQLHFLSRKKIHRDIKAKREAAGEKQPQPLC